MKISKNARSLFSSVVLLYALGLTTHVAAQTERNQDVTIITADEYTAMILGEIEIPSASGIYQIYDESHDYGRDLITNNQLIPLGDLPSIAIPEEDEYAVAYLVFIKQLNADIKRLGKGNSIKLYAAGYEISEQAAEAIVDSIISINSLHVEMLNAIKVQNCIDYSNELTTADAELAAEKFIQSEERLDDATLNYFRGVDETLIATLPGQVYESFQELISSMKDNVRSANVDTDDLITNSGLTKSAYISGLCDHRLTL